MTANKDASANIQSAAYEEATGDSPQHQPPAAGAEKGVRRS